MPGPAAKRTDWPIAAALFVFTFILRMPFRTTLLYAWDSVLYTRAISHFDITIDQPQPPGHIFFVGIIWIVNHVFGDPNSAMVWVSIFFSAASVSALYLLGRKMFGRRAGIVAALLLATSLSFWGYSEAAYPYTLLAFLSIALAGAIYRVWEGSATWLMPAGLLLGLASGFRQDLLPFMLPLLAAAAWDKGWRRQLGAAALLVAGTAAWYIPSALLSGGFAAYQEASSRQSDYLIRYFSVFGRGAGGLVTNTHTLGRFLLYGLTAAAALLPVLAMAVFRKRTRRVMRDRRLVFLLVWIAPSVIFYALIHIGEFGYVFSFLPALLLLLSWSLELWAGRRVWALAGPVVAANLLLFLVMTPPLSANRLAAHDDILRSKIATIEENFNPDTTLIVSVYDFQQVRYYLPGFRSWTFDPSVERKPAAALPPEVETVIIFDDYMRPDKDAALRLPLDREQTLMYLKRGSARSLRVDWDRRKICLEDE